MGSQWFPSILKHIASYVISIFVKLTLYNDSVMPTTQEKAGAFLWADQEKTFCNCTLSKTQNVYIYTVSVTKGLKCLPYM